jgi:hypothetical protein
MSAASPLSALPGSHQKPARRASPLLPLSLIQLRLTLVGQVAPQQTRFFLAGNDGAVRDSIVLPYRVLSGACVATTLLASLGH